MEFIPGMQGWCNIPISMNFTILQGKKNQKEKSSVHLNRCRKKHLTKSTTLHNKHFQQTSKRCKLLQKVKAQPLKKLYSIIPIGKIFNAFFIRLGTSQGYPLKPFIFNAVLKS